MQLPRSTRTLSLMTCVLSARSAAQTPADTVRPVSLREQAAALARTGWASDDPRAVLAAAQLLIILEQGSGGIRRVDSGAGRRAVPNDWNVPGDLDAKSLLRLASEMAVERRDRVTAQIAAALASRPELAAADTSLARALARAAAALGGTRGAVGEPRWVEGYLRNDEVAEFAIPFEGRSVINRVTVSASDDHSGLKCDLFEGQGAKRARMPAQSVDAHKAQCALSWKQTAQGAITLRIRNTGGPGYFVLLTN